MKIYFLTSKNKNIILLFHVNLLVMCVTVTLNCLNPPPPPPKCNQDTFICSGWRVSIVANSIHHVVRSENSESSDAIESSWKGDCVVEQNITPGSSGRLRDDTSSGKLRDDTSSGRLQDDASSGRLRDGGSSGRLWGNASSGRLRDEAGSGRLRDEAGSGRLQTEVATKTKWRSNPIKHGSPGDDNTVNYS